jgi:prevent-host-death family protein
MKKINVAEAKRHFSRLLGQVAYGKEEIVIVRHNQPMAKLVPIETERKAHLADAKGWLPNDDPFFSDLDKVVKDRQKHIPRYFKQEK